MRSRHAVSYQKAVEEIYGLDRLGSRLGLDRMREILSELGNPHESYVCVLVGGSNGKGSTVSMAGEILRSAGFKVGTYFSPQVVEFPERIMINGRCAGRHEIVDAYLRVKEVCQRHSIKATFFEVVTAMALLIFEARKVRYAVLEVGLGGRLDATNATEPEISAIASISLEHTDVLGNTVEQIAHEKCGIARRGKKLVCGIIAEDAKRAVKGEADAIGADIIFVEDDMRLSHLQQVGRSYSFKTRYAGVEFALSLGAPGRFQISNACLAAALCHELGVEKKAIERGLSRAAPPFRLQQLSRRPAVIADCCHNPEAAFALSNEAEHFQSERKVLLFSAMKDKDHRRVLKILKSHFDAVVLCEVALARAASLAQLKATARKEGIQTLGASTPENALKTMRKTEGTCAFAVKKPKHALAFAKGLAGKKGCVFIGGSIYLLAELFGKDRIRIAQ